VGIAEQHAVTLAAGMVTQGKQVFCTIYSTFLQRALDQVIHDVALQSLPVVFCIDRAGLVGEDGATHHGVFDIALLRPIPNLIIAAPSDEIELRNLLYTASLGFKKPIVIRYPRGRGKIKEWKKEFSEVEIGKGRKLKNGSDMAIISIGTTKTEVQRAIEKFSDSKKIAHYDLRFVKPLDELLLTEILEQYQIVITVEDGVITGGAGEAISVFALKNGYRANIVTLGVPDIFIEHGTTQELKDLAGISTEKILEKIQEYI